MRKNPLEKKPKKYIRFLCKPIVSIIIYYLLFISHKNEKKNEWNVGKYVYLRIHHVNFCHADIFALLQTSRRKSVLIIAYVQHETCFRH